jgi:hypothetical protein
VRHSGRVLQQRCHGISTASNTLSWARSMCWQVDLAEIVTAYNWVAATVYEAIVKKGERSPPPPPPAAQSCSPAPVYSR